MSASDDIVAGCRDAIARLSRGAWSWAPQIAEPGSRRTMGPWTQLPTARLANRRTEDGFEPAQGGVIRREVVTLSVATPPPPIGSQVRGPDGTVYELAAIADSGAGIAHCELRRDVPIIATADRGLPA